MAIASDVISSAATRTRHVLFEPLEISKYSRLAVCAWLYALTTDGGVNNRLVVNLDLDHGSQGWTISGWPLPFDPLDPALRPILVTVAGVAVVLALVLLTAMLFLSCRGAFMLIDGIVRNRGAVVEPWKEFAAEANSLFALRLVLHAATAAVTLGTMGLIALVLWDSWQGFAAMTPALVAALVAGGAVVAAVGFTAAVLDACAWEFVAPLMYARRTSVWAGFRDLWRCVRDEPSSFVLYVAVRVVGTLVVAVLSLALTCASCGTAALPFVGTLILLPFLVFLRTLSIEFVAQLGDDLRVALAPADQVYPLPESR